MNSRRGESDKYPEDKEKPNRKRKRWTTERKRDGGKKPGNLIYVILLGFWKEYNLFSKLKNWFSFFAFILIFSSSLVASIVLLLLLLSNALILNLMHHGRNNSIEWNESRKKKKRKKNSKISKFELKSQPMGTKNNKKNKNWTTNYINGKAQTTWRRWE